MTTASTATSSPKRVVLTVSRLNQEVNALLQQQFGMLWVEGELSNFSRPGSGHFYFSLKDSRSQLRCAMFRGRNRYIDFQPEDGQQILLRGKLGIYEARGDYQFIAEHMELAGSGALQQKFEQTKARLQAAGWFDHQLKKDIPMRPRALGIITSPTGAAIRDIINVIHRRYPCVDIIIYPTQVQGASAAPDICRAISTANKRNEVDTLIVARGGGSLEDLWAFNEESVAEHIHRSQIPVISGVGHEVDYTIADMVADVRAPTPSAAAELAVPHRDRELENLQSLKRHLQQAMQYVLLPAQTQIAQLLNRLQLRHPEHVILQQQLLVAELDARMVQALSNLHSEQSAQLDALRSRLLLSSPKSSIEAHRAQLNLALHTLKTSINRKLDHKRAHLASASSTLNGVSPLATLARGYAVIRKGKILITDSSQLKVGDNINGLLAKGEFNATVSDRSD